MTRCALASQLANALLTGLLILAVLGSPGKESALGIGVSGPSMNATLMQGTDEVYGPSYQYVSSASGQLSGGVLIAGVSVHYDEDWEGPDGFPYWLYESAGGGLWNPRFASDTELYFDPNDRSDHELFHRANPEATPFGINVPCYVGSVTLPPGDYSIPVFFSVFTEEQHQGGAHFLPGIIKDVSLHVEPNPNILPTRWTLRNTSSGTLRDGSLMVNGRVWAHNIEIPPGQSYSYTNSFVPENNFSFAAMWEDPQAASHPVFALGGQGNAKGAAFADVFPGAAVPADGLDGVKLAHGDLPFLRPGYGVTWDSDGPAADPFQSVLSIPHAGGYSVGLYAFSDGQQIGELSTVRVPEPSTVALTFSLAAIGGLIMLCRRWRPRRCA